MTAASRGSEAVVTNWSAVEDAMVAMRRLNRAVAGFEVTDDELAALAQAAHGLAQRLEQGTRRSKQEDVLRVTGGRAMADLAATPIGGSVQFDAFSAAGGRFHPSSVGMSFVRDGETSVRATATVDAMFQGPPGRVHGGIVAMLIDEVMGVVNRTSGIVAFTGQLSVRYRAPAPIDEELVFRAWREGIDGRKVSLRAEGVSAEGVFAEAEGLFIVPREPVGGIGPG